MAAAACCISISGNADSQSVPFLLEFGSPLLGPDEGRFLSESMNGDIIVAGYGVSSSRAIVGGRGSPMLARISRSGHLVWQRIHAELAEDQVIGLFSDDNGDFLLLSRVRYEGTPLERTVYRYLFLRKIGSDGEVSEVVSVLSVACLSAPESGSVGPIHYSDHGNSGLMVVATADTGIPSSAVCEGENKSTFVLFSDGSFEEKPRPDEYWPSQHLENGVTMLYKNELSGAFTVARTGFSGEIETLFQLPAETMVIWRRNVFATPTSLFLTREYTIDGERRSSVSTYSLSGQLNSDRELSAQFLRSPAATARGGIVLIGEDRTRREVRIFEIAPDGDVLWNSEIKAEQGVGAAYNAIVLRDGWLAVTGLTGPLAWEAAMFRPEVKREAFILVSELSPEGISAANQLE